MSSYAELEKFHSGQSFKSYEFFGCHRQDDGKFIFRVWAPHACKINLIGDFNNWNETSDQMERLSDGESFEISTAAEAGQRYAYLISTYDN